MDDLLLYKFLQNEASEDEIRTVLDWLDADPANRKYFDGLDNMLNAARVNRPAGRKPCVVRSRRCAVSAHGACASRQSCAYVSE